MSKERTLISNLIRLHESVELAPKLADELASLPLPTQKEEEWKYTSLRELKKHQFLYGVSADCATDSFEFVEGDFAATITFVNGELDSIVHHDLPEGLTIEVRQQNENETTESTALFADDLFTKVNHHLGEEELHIEVKSNTLVSKPIYIRHLYQLSNDLKILGLPRIVLKAEKSSSVKIIEDYIGDNDSVYLSMPLTQFDLSQQAHVVHVKLQRESKKAFHIARIGADLRKDSHYESYTVNLGSLLYRGDVVARQMEEAVNCTLDGLVLIDNYQHSDTHTLMDHREPWGESHQLHKVIADGHSESVFNGKIFVQQDAQKTNSFQENRSMMLSQTCTINSKPQLEIFADDVKCSHGATIGQMEDDHLFYLKSRGLGETDARKLLTYAFAGELIEKIPLDEVKPLIERAIQRFTESKIAETVNA